MPTMDKCVLKGVHKVSRIMSGQSFICRHCGLAYDKFLKADRCCNRAKADDQRKRKLEKSSTVTQVILAVRDRIDKGEFDARL